MNLYAYVGNDPINLKDPLGLHRSAVDERMVRKQEEEVEKQKSKLESIDEEIVETQSKIDDPSSSEGTREGSKIRLQKLEKKRDRQQNRISREKSKLNRMQAALNHNKTHDRTREEKIDDAQTALDVICVAGAAAGCRSNPYACAAGLAACGAAIVLENEEEKREDDEEDG